MGGSGIAPERAIAGLLRVSSLALVTLVAGGLTWSATAQPGVLAAAPEPARAIPLGRMRALAPALVEAEPLAVRAHPQTAAALQSALGVGLGPQDRIEPSPDAAVRPETVVRVVSPGAGGEVVRTFTVRQVDGVESERTIVSESELSAAVSEVRVVGTRPRPAPPAPSEIAGIVHAAADHWGADAETLLRVAWCESRYNPSAYNHASGASGLFQFMPGTFARNSVRAGYGGASIWDPVASANTAAMLFASGQSAQWACK